MRGLVQSRVHTVCLVILSTVAVGAALYWLGPVLIPFVLAIFIAEGLTPLIDLQMKHLRLPRLVAVVSTLVLGLVLLVLLTGLATASVSQLSANADAYAAQLGRLVERVVAWLPDQIAGISPEEEIQRLSSPSIKTVGSLLVGTSTALLGVLSKSLLVFIFVCFLLLGGGGRGDATGVWGQAEASIKRFLVTKALISAATGLLVGLTLSLLGIDLALVFGLFAFLLNFIPNVGSIVATLLPLAVVVMSPETSASTALLAIGIPGVIQIGIGNVFEPRIMGKSLDLHPVAILIALIFWGILWGIVGMLLATPITAVMKIVFERFEGTRMLSDLLAGDIEALRSPEEARA